MHTEATASDLNAAELGYTPGSAQSISELSSKAHGAEIADVPGGVSPMLRSGVVTVLWVLGHPNWVT